MCKVKNRNDGNIYLLSIYIKPKVPNNLYVKDYCLKTRE